MKSHNSSSLVPAGDLGPLFMRIGVGVVFAWHGWLKFDDNVVSQVSEDDVKGLFGGGDWHMSYLLLYRAAPWRTTV